MNQETISLKKSIEELKGSADKFAPETDKKTELEEMKTLIVKGNVLKGAEKKKEEEVDNVLSKKKILMKRLHETDMTFHIG